MPRSYFTERFPGLFMACYTFALRHCGESGPIADFLPPNDRTLMAPFLASNRPSCGVRQLVMSRISALPERIDSCVGHLSAY